MSNLKYLITYYFDDIVDLLFEKARQETGNKKAPLTLKDIYTLNVCDDDFIKGIFLRKTGTFDVIIPESKLTKTLLTCTEPFKVGNKVRLRPNFWDIQDAGKHILISSLYKKCLKDCTLTVTSAHTKKYYPNHKHTTYKLKGHDINNNFLEDILVDSLWIESADEPKREPNFKFNEKNSSKVNRSEDILIRELARLCSSATPLSDEAFTTAFRTLTGGHTNTAEI